MSVEERPRSLRYPLVTPRADFKNGMPARNGVKDGFLISVKPCAEMLFSPSEGLTRTIRATGLMTMTLHIGFRHLAFNTGGLLTLSVITSGIRSLRKMWL